MTQQHNLLIRPPHLACATPASLPPKDQKTPQKHQAQKFLQVCFLQRVGSAVLSAGQILALLLCLEVFYFFAHVGRCFPHPGAWELPVHNPSALICPTHVIPPLLSHQSRQREGSVLGSGSAVTHSSCPGDGHTDPSWTAQLWCHQLVFHCACYLILHTRLKAAPEVQWNPHSCTKPRQSHTSFLQIITYTSRVTNQNTNFPIFKVWGMVSQPKHLWTLDVQECLTDLQVPLCSELW